jgi:transcriptional regulator with XRE-family HTH domain
MAENRLREYRQQAGLSQNRLAQRCRMHPAHLCLIERGATTTQRTARKLARALAVSPARLFPSLDMLREG